MHGPALDDLASATVQPLLGPALDVPASGRLPLKLRLQRQSPRSNSRSGNNVVSTSLSIECTTAVSVRQRCNHGALDHPQCARSLRRLICPAHAAAPNCGGKVWNEQSGERRPVVCGLKRRNPAGKPGSYDQKRRRVQPPVCRDLQLSQEALTGRRLPNSGALRSRISRWLPRSRPASC